MTFVAAIAKNCRGTVNSPSSGNKLLESLRLNPVVPTIHKEALMRKSISALILLLTFQISAFAQIDDKIADRLYESAKVFDELMRAPDGPTAKKVLKDAECVAVIPGVKKAALGIGGTYGRGTIICRKDNGKGPWGSPSMIALGGGSIGIQIGGQSNDVVMMFMTPESVQRLLKDKVTLGADASAAAGPKGREISAETSATMRAEILTYGRSQGVFAGISLKGAVVSTDKDGNKSLYKSEISAKDLLITGNVAIPQPARKLIDALTAAGN
jgi:SH3 domain-containing YSC84-like protein 1